jgi:hypothetical protein
MSANNNSNEGPPKGNSCLTHWGPLRLLYDHQMKTFVHESSETAAAELLELPRPIYQTILIPLVVQARQALLGMLYEDRHLLIQK